LLYNVVLRYFKTFNHEEMRPTQIDGRLLFHEFFHVPTNAHILLAATRTAACHEELCMTHRQIRIPSDDSFFLSFTNVAGRLQEPKWHWLMSSHRALTGTCKCVLGYVARIIIPARPFTAGNLTCDESQKG